MDSQVKSVPAPNGRPSAVRRASALLGWLSLAAMVLLPVVWLLSGWWLLLAGSTFGRASQWSGVGIGEGVVVLIMADRPPEGLRTGVRLLSSSGAAWSRTRWVWPTVERTPVSQQVILPLWLFWLPLVAGWGWWWVKRRRWRRLLARARRPCPACGYDLHSLPPEATCPECGGVSGDRL